MGIESRLKKPYIISRLQQIVRIEKLNNMRTNCISCRVKNLNWIAELQDFLEESSIQPQDFCSNGHDFEFENNRLRVKKCAGCIQFRDVVDASLKSAI